MKHTFSAEELKDDGTLDGTKNCSMQTTRRNFKTANSDDSGYNSASEAANTSEEEQTTSASEPFLFSSDISSNSSSDGAGDDCDEDVLSSQIEYLREKQRLLKRASRVFAREEAYDAANALRDANQPNVDALCVDSIWNQAREYLELTTNPEEQQQQQQGSSLSAAAAEQVSQRMPPPLSTIAAAASASRSPATTMMFQQDAACRTTTKKRPLIDVSHVDHATSKQYQDGLLYNNNNNSSGDNNNTTTTTNNNNSNNSANATSSLQLLSRVNMFAQGQWMAQALVWSTSTATTTTTQPPGTTTTTASGGNNSSSNNSNTQWRVVSDPQTCSLGLLPPSDLSMNDSVTLQEAIAITDEPRLVAQSTPPFCVVYVNKTFLALAGLVSSKSIIGTPIESVLQVVVSQQEQQEEIITTTGNSNSNKYLQSIILVSPSKNKPCRIRVVPVVDRSKRRRIHHHHHVVENNHHHNHHRRSSYMSHILIPVVVAQVAPPPLLQQAQAQQSARRRQRESVTMTVVEHSYESDPPDRNAVYGTVG